MNTAHSTSRPTTPWRWRGYIPLRSQDMLNYLVHSVTSQNIRILNVNTV